VPPPTAVAEPPAPASVDDVRRRNLSALLRLLHERGATSRADLTALTGLNRSTVKTLTEDLVVARLVRELTPVGRGGAGRPSILVEPASDRVYVLAVDVGVEHLTALRIGLGGVVLDRRRLDQAPGDYPVRRTITRVARLVHALLDGAPPDARCVGIGVGVCGVVSDADGVVRFAPNLGWVDVPFGGMLADRLGTSMPIALGNDGDLGLLAEHLRGAARGLTDVVYIAGEVGIGGGLLVGGRPMRGAGGYGGEIGHMVVDPKGPVCRCGRRGCWETLISDTAVLAATGAAPGTSLQEALEAYASGQAWPRAGLRRVARAIGTGTANLVNIFNPQLIVYGGAIRHVFTAVEPLVRDALTGVLAAPAEQVRLAPAGLGDDSVAVGASELAFAALLDDPLGSLATLPPVVRAHA
jgi:predicted NBD/HSP70 family sugar kinase